MGTTNTHVVNRFSLTEVHKPDHANVDIVFVHGLNGHPQQTWTSEKSHIFWPADLLPPILEDEKARILVYGYDADVISFTDGASKDRIHNHAESLVATLTGNRRIRKMTERPIIFVAHSLGGLVVKRALIHSSENRSAKTQHLRDIFVSTYGILFLGTPHKGSNMAEWGARLARICKAVLPSKVLSTEPYLVESLKQGNDTLVNIDRGFIQMINRFRIYFFHEAKPTDFKGKLEFVVEEDSAAPTVQDVERAGIQADHSHMCKFEDDNAPGFDLVAEAIQRYAGTAPAATLRRWAGERQERIQWGKEIFDENAFDYPDSGKETPRLASTHPSPSNSSTNLLLMSTSPPLTSPPLTSPPLKITRRDEPAITEFPAHPAVPYWIVPDGFRANSYFVGRDKELQKLQELLFDHERRSEGTSCVLIYGQPGVGKSHLARQYVNKNQGKFSGGIFWINSKAKVERHTGFWKIHEQVPELSSKGADGKWHERVKMWFEARQNWLIVFDGVILDKDADATDLRSIVPDSRNSSIIYISLSKSLDSKQRLLRPLPIKVAPLHEDDATKLLFKELNIEKPSHAEMKSAIELVRKMGGLPLAIDAISHRLADTHEPLTKLNIKSYSADPKLKGTYRKIIDDLKLQQEAWNLINILCFFGQHIPVEMVHLGLKDLPIEVRSSQNGEKANLNPTFSTLIKYALIERNEPDDKDSISSSRGSLGDPIDMLKLHSVVQKFCCDSLHAEGVLSKWLLYAVKLFICSYKKADEKIKQKPEPGRISDYRDYLVQGHRLLDHSRYYKTKAQPLDDIGRELDPILSIIQEEIRSREPSSSQGSVNQVTSIFDRINSSSDSAASINEAPNPDHGKDIYGPGFDMPVDSPSSLHTSSPTDMDLIRHGAHGLGMKMPPPNRDDGYDGDAESAHARPMQKSLSDITARPPRSPSPGWQIVPPSRKPRKPRDLGERRPYRAIPARVQVSKESAIGQVGRIKKSREELRALSVATKSLREINHHSPPRKPGLSIWQRNPPSLSRKGRPQSTHGDGKPHQVNIHVSTSPPNVKSEALQRVRSGDSLHRGHGHIPSLPRLPELEPHLESINSSIPAAQYIARPFVGDLMAFDPRYNNHSGTYAPESSRPCYINENFHPRPNSSPYRISGPNPDPLPIVQDVSITRSWFEFKTPIQSPPYPDYPYYSRHPSQSPRSQSRRPPSPPSYTSQPISRDTSHHSHHSAETEPVHQSHYARYPSSNAGLSPPPPHPLFASPRDADGRPLRKSPKTANDHQSPSGYEVSGAGGWAVQAMSRDGSRPTSTGPGLAILDGGLVQFGEHDPISIEEARQRNLRLAREIEMFRAQEASSEEAFERGRRPNIAREEHRRPPGYPPFNLIPTPSDPVGIRH